MIYGETYYIDLKALVKVFHRATRDEKAWIAFGEDAFAKIDALASTKWNWWMYMYLNNEACRSDIEELKNLYTAMRQFDFKMTAKAGEYIGQRLVSLFGIIATNRLCDCPDVVESDMEKWAAEAAANFVDDMRYLIDVLKA